MGSQVSCLEEDSAAVEEVNATFQRCRSPPSPRHAGLSNSIAAWKESSLGLAPFSPVFLKKQVSRQTSPGVSSLRSRQLSIPYQGRELSQFSESGSLRWANALDRPSDFARAIVELAMDFPMYLKPAKVLMNLKGPLQPHHELVNSGKLVRWQQGHTGKVVLISHQWAGKRHPDPNMEQIKVLQDLLREMASGRVQVTKDLIAEASGSELVLPSKEEQRNCMEWDIWYDFFGIPQVDDRGCVTSIPELQAAVDSIPAYCDAADYVIILAPTGSHADTGALMNYATWGTRGWCRAERTATALSAKEKPLLVVTGPSSIFASSGAEWIQRWPHDGNFTVEEDRTIVTTLTKQLLELKCASMLQLGDVSRWRFYKALSVKILQSRPAWSKEQILDSFRVSYQFASVLFLEPGLTPLMLACIEGSTETLELLIDSKADVNASCELCLREAQLEGTHTALSIAAALSSPQVIACLLKAGAQPASCDNKGNSLIGIAALFGNHQVIPLLAEKGVAVQKSNLRGDCPLICAMLAQNAEVLRVLLDLRATPNVKSSFGQTPLSMCAMQGLVDPAAYLLEAGADVTGDLARSESQQVKCRESAAFGSLAKSAGLRESGCDHTVEEILAGTPLHLAAIHGNWPMAQLLLRYNADPLDVGNMASTPIDLAQDYGQSDLLLKLTAVAPTDYFFI